MFESLSRKALAAAGGLFAVSPRGGQSEPMATDPALMRRAREIASAMPPLTNRQAAIVSGVLRPRDAHTFRVERPTSAVLRPVDADVEDRAQHAALLA